MADDWSLYLVGQSAIAPGLLCVTLRVLRGVGEVAGRAIFQNFLAGKLVAKLWFIDAPHNY